MTIFNVLRIVTTGISSIKMSKIFIPWKIIIELFIYRLFIYFFFLFLSHIRFQRNEFDRIILVFKIGYAMALLDGNLGEA